MPLFGIGKKPVTPQEAIQKLQETQKQISDKIEFIQIQIEQALMVAKSADNQTIALHVTTFVTFFINLIFAGYETEEKVGKIIGAIFWHIKYNWGTNDGTGYYNKQ